MLLASIDDGLLAAAPQAISVDFDATFLVQLVLMTGLTLVLKPLLFDPMLRLFEERERRIDGAKMQARKIDEKSASALSKYEAEMARARAAANAERDKIRAEAAAARVRVTLKDGTGVLARDLAGRVLGREVQS